MITGQIENENLGTTATATLARISAGIDSSVAPMITQLLNIIKDLSGRAEVMSVNDLAEFINGEPTTMGRIVSIASSVGYNSSGAEIASIHHAISMIGFDRVRTLAISILLLETVQSPSAAQTNRELAGQALISGLVAAEICRRGVPADAELAFICGTLRSYGRMLAATFMPGEYAEAVKLGERSRQHEAFETVFGLSPLDLTRHILHGMQVPNNILCSFAALTPETRKQASAGAPGALIAAGDFGLRTAELLQMPDLNTHNFEHRMETLSYEYDAAFALTKAATREILHHVIGVLECFRCRASSYMGSVGIFRRLECLAAERPLPAPFTVVTETTVVRARPPETDGGGNYDI